MAGFMMIIYDYSLLIKIFICLEHFQHNVVIYNKRHDFQQPLSKPQAPYCSQEIHCVVGLYRYTLR